MKEPKDYIIFPLDVPGVDEAKRYVRMLAGSVGMFKVGLELFIAGGPDIISCIKDEGGAKIFLDLKLHDIPETVRRSMKRVADLDVALATVHCGESERMLQAAAQGAGDRVKVLGVTVLTSVNSDDIKDAGFKEEYCADMQRLVLERAKMAKTSGCAGIVCSPAEVKTVKDKLGDAFLGVTPGVRPLWDVTKKDDQQRVTTPAQAIKNGSDYLVIGRPIRDAKDPVMAAYEISQEIEAAL